MGLFNALMLAYVLWFTLVVTHAFMADQAQRSMRIFYLPKVGLGFCMFVVIMIYQVSDKYNSLAFYKNRFKTDPNTQSFFNIVYLIYCFVCLGYFSVYGYYLYNVIKNALRAGPRSHKQRFSAEVIAIILFLSLLTTVLAAFPNQNKT